MAQAVYVTVLGMALVFLALAIVMLVALALGRLFPPQSEEEKAVLPAAAAQAGVASAEEETRIAATIAATLTILEQQTEAEAAPSWPESVLTLERIAQGWKAAGRLAGMR